MQEWHDGGGIYCFAGKELVLRGKVIFAADSPALTLGIKSIDVNGAGPRRR